MDQSTGWPCSRRKSSKAVRKGCSSVSLKGAADDPTWQEAISFLSNLLVMIKSNHLRRKVLNESGMDRPGLLQSGSDCNPPPSSKLYGNAFRAFTDDLGPRIPIYVTVVMG